MNPKSSIGAYNLAWLISPSGDAVRDTGPDTEYLDYGLPPETGKAWAESLALRDGIILFRAVHELAPSCHGQLVPLLDVDTKPEEPMFNAQVWVSGLGCHDEYWKGRDGPPTRIIAGPGRDTFRIHQDWHAKVMVEGGATSEMRSIVVPDRQLRTLLGEATTRDLLDRLGLSSQRPTVVLPMPLHVSAPLREATSAELTGAVRKLYAQARILDYLAGLLAFVSGGKTVRKERTHQAKIHELHQYLLEIEGRVPTLTELAKKFSLSARRLNAEFSKEYGQSIFNFITDHRLAQAHAILLSDPIALKTLAMRLGYSHVNHFSTAFKKKFGYPPGSLKRKQ